MGPGRGGGCGPYYSIRLLNESVYAFFFPYVRACVCMRVCVCVRPGRDMDHTVVLNC